MVASQEIIIGTGYDDSYAKLGDFTSRVNKDYADHFGFEFRCFRKPYDDRPAPWHKILFARDCLPHCEWFFWIDADAALINKMHDLRQYIPNEQGIFFAVANGRNINQFNTGLFFLKNCELSIRFLNEIYAQTQFINHGWWEQKAALHVTNFKDSALRIKNDFFPNIKLYGYNTFWARPEDLNRGVPAIHVPGPYGLGIKKRKLETCHAKAQEWFKAFGTQHFNACSNQGTV